MALGVTNEKRKPARLLLEELFARAEIKFRKETTIVLLWVVNFDGHEREELPIRLLGAMTSRVVRFHRALKSQT